MDHPRTEPVFQPTFVFLCSLTGAALIGLYLFRYEHVRASVLDPGGTFWYFVPLMVPCFAFMIERVQHVRQANFFQHGVDFFVFGFSCRKSNGRRCPVCIGSYSSAQLHARELEVQHRSPLIDTGPGPNVVLEVLRLGRFRDFQCGDRVRLRSRSDCLVGFETVQQTREWQVMRASPGPGS
ncbi:MAG: hypothetical protein V7638_3976 [Acidobacteriota bacterium]|jgi:hypothetical protein